MFVHYESSPNLRSLASPVFFIGPAFCGKSQLAEQALTESMGANIFGTADVSEPELASLVESHKVRRPKLWKTVEDIEDIHQCLKDLALSEPQLLIDSINQWVAGLFVKHGPKYGLEQVQKMALSEAHALGDFLKSNQNVRVVMVSSEIASGLPPQSNSGRFFRQTLGQVNQILASYCRSVVLVTAGIPYVIKKDES